MNQMMLFSEKLKCIKCGLIEEDFDLTKQMFVRNYTPHDDCLKIWCNRCNYHWNMMPSQEGPIHVTASEIERRLKRRESYDKNDL